VEFRYLDPTRPADEQVVRRMLAPILDLAHRHGLKVRTCCERFLATSGIIERGACVNGPRLVRVFGPGASTKSDDGQRKSSAAAARARSTSAAIRSTASGRMPAATAALSATRGVERRHRFGDERVAVWSCELTHINEVHHDADVVECPLTRRAEAGSGAQSERISRVPVQRLAFTADNP
jgi:hypothetical protein